MPALLAANGWGLISINIMIFEEPRLTKFNNFVLDHPGDTKLTPVI